MSDTRVRRKIECAMREARSTVRSRGHEPDVADYVDAVFATDLHIVENRPPWPLQESDVWERLRMRAVQLQEIGSPDAELLSEATDRITELENRIADLEDGIACV